MLLAQTTYSTSMSGSPLFGLVGLAFFVFFVVTMWKIFSKAGEPGWAAVIPIYNYLVLLKIVGRPWWWLLLFLIPIVNIVLAIIVVVDLAKAFGKGGGFAVGLIFLGIIFFPILAFGSSQYVGQKAY
jgi:hypothetical protein